MTDSLMYLFIYLFIHSFISCMPLRLNHILTSTLNNNNDNNNNNNNNKCILLDVLLCSIAEHFNELCRNIIQYKQRVKID